jgi:predicted HicB family RNase H-like nuclease
MSRGNPIFRLRLAPEARERWEAAAADVGVSLSEWIRLVIELSLKRQQG